MKNRKPEDNVEEQLSLELENLYKEIDRPDKIEKIDKLDKGEGGAELDLRPAYDLFKVGPDADHEELKAAYEELASAWNPKRFEDHPEWKEKAEKKLEIINKAYEMILSARIREIRKKRKSIQLGEIEKDVEESYSRDFEEVEDEQEEEAPRRFGLKHALILAGIPVFLLMCWFVVSPLFENPPDKAEKKAAVEKLPPLARNVQQMPVPETKTEAKPDAVPEPKIEVKAQPADPIKTDIKTEAKPEIKKEAAAEPPRAVASQPSPPAAKPSPKKPPAPALRPVAEPRQAPKTAAASPEPLKKSAAAAKPFSIQVGAVKDRAKGQEYLGKVKKDGLSGTVVETVLPNGERGYRILVGAFQTREEALAYLNSKNLKQKYPGSFIQKNKP